MRRYLWAWLLLGSAYLILVWAFSTQTPVEAQTSIFGRMGQTGLTGGTGANGATGATGGSGSNGAGGITGATGATGGSGSNGSAGATGASGNTVNDVAGMAAGVPTSSQLVLHFVADRSFTLPVTGSTCHAVTAATAQTDFVVSVNGSTKGTLRFAAMGSTCSIVSPTSTSIAAGDYIKITAPGSADATLADIAFTLMGTIP